MSIIRKVRLICGIRHQTGEGSTTGGIHGDITTYGHDLLEPLVCKNLAMSLLGLSQSHELIERQSGTSRSHNVLFPDAQVAPVPGVEVEPVATIEPDTELTVSPSVRRRADQSPSQVKYVRKRTVQPNLFSENLLKSGNFSVFWDSRISEVSL